MKTQEFTTPEATREALADLVAAGHVLHGSPVPDLNVLQASETGFIHNDKDGNEFPKNKLVCGTNDPDYAIFFAAVHAPIRDERKARNIPRRIVGSSIFHEVNAQGRAGPPSYYANDGAKAFIRKREETLYQEWTDRASRMLSAVYFYPKAGLTYSEEDFGWVTSEDVHPLGSIAVTTACLSFDFYSLPSPDSHPKIRVLVAELDERLVAE